MDINPEMPDPAHLPDLLGREQELGHIPEVFTHGPNNLASIDASLVPFQKFPCCSHVLGDGFLRENMLACKKSPLDELGLDQDREAFCCSISSWSGCHRVDRWHDL